jgi:hypothetical protein
MAVVVFRWTRGDTPEHQDRINHAILDAVNASGQAFMIHTVLHVRVVLRLAIGNVRTTEDHVMATWALLPKIADDFR